MYITNVTDYDNRTDDYNNTLLTKYTIIDKILPSLLLTVPCGLSFLCLFSLMVYTLIKPLKNIK